MKKKRIWSDEYIKLLQSAFANPSENAGAAKAQILAWTNDQSVSTSAKQLHLNAYPEADQQHEVEPDEELASPASRWQASRELTALIESFHKPLQTFDRKSTCRKFLRPDTLRRPILQP